MKPSLLFSLFSGTGATFYVAAESIVTLQALGSETPVSFDRLVQLGFLLAAVVLIARAGVLWGKWESAQRTLLSEVKKIPGLRDDLSYMRGVLRMLEIRTRGKGVLFDEGEDDGLQAAG